MAGFRIEGNTSGNVAEVDASNQLQVATGDASTVNGLLATTSRVDLGEVTGTIVDFEQEVDQDYRLRIAGDRLEFVEPFSGTTLNTGAWATNVTTMATAVASGALQLNSASNAAINTVARVNSYRTFAFPVSGQITAHFPLRIVASAVGIANTTWEVGFFIASGTTAPTDGIFLRMNASGELRLVESFNGTETTSSVINYNATPTGWSGALLPVNTTRSIIISVHFEQVRLWIDNALAATLDRPAANVNPTQSLQLPLTFRIYNGGSAPASGTQIQIGPVSVLTGGNSCNTATVRESASLSEAGGYQGYSGATAGQTVNYANSAAPASATLSNTAAGYTTLGGQFQFAAVAGAETDYALFGFQVPAVASGSHNRNMLIYGVSISTINTGAAVATTVSALQWAIGVGATAVSLATAEAASAKAPRRVPLGFQSFAVGAAIGAAATDIVRNFNVPLMAEAGTFVHIILKLPIGTATASQVIRGLVQIDAAWV